MTDSSVYNNSSADTAHDANLSPVLLEKAKQGEEKALAEIYGLYFKKIFKFIFYRVSHRETAEDLAEDVFVKAFVKLPSLHADVSFAGWLYQIARNLVIDYYRRKKMNVPLEDVENTLEYETNVVDAVNLDQNQKILLKAMRQLGAEQQLVLRLKFFEELENSEIAAIVRKSEGAVRVIQHRALTQLQQIIQQGLK